MIEKQPLHRVEITPCGACGCHVVLLEALTPSMNAVTCLNCDRVRGVRRLSDEDLALSGARRCAQGPVLHDHEPDLALMRTSYAAFLMRSRKSKQSH